MTISEQDDSRTGESVLRMGDCAGDMFGEELGESESDEITSGVLGRFRRARKDGEGFRSEPPLGGKGREEGGGGSPRGAGCSGRDGARVGNAGNGGGGGISTGGG